MHENLIKEAEKEGLRRFVVGAIILRDSAVLLLERPEDDFMGGICEFPSGKVEKGETLEDALFREVEEETRLKVKEIKQYLGYFDYESEKGEKTRQFNFLIIVEEPIEVRLKEHKNYIWLRRNQLDKYPVTNKVKDILSHLSWA